MTITTAGVFTYTPTAVARHNAALSNADALLTADTVNIVVTDPAGLTATTAITVPITPKNAAPTARTTVKAPNANAGVVYGKVAGKDPDKDRLLYSVNATTAKGGTVTVNGGGAFTYTPTPEARHIAATGTDKTDTFTVTVDDGHGGILAVPVTVVISPKNTAPTGKANIGPRDVNTGVVERRGGRRRRRRRRNHLRGIDHDGQGLGRRQRRRHLHLHADAAARAKAAVFTGPTADKIDTFSVTLADGHGGTTKVAVTITISPSNTIAGKRAHHVLWLHSDARRHDLPRRHQRPSGAGEIRHVARRPGRRPRRHARRRLGQHVDEKHRRYAGQRGGRDAPQRVRGLQPRLLDERPQHRQQAVRDSESADRRGHAVAAGLGPSLLVFQEGTCISQELYNVANGVEMPANSPLDGLGNALYRVRYGSKWIAEAGVHYDMSSALYPAGGWANASHLPYLPLILRPDDLARGSIDHMLGIVIAKDKGTGYTWPAGAGDGTGVNPDGVPMGSVLRLRADFDMSGYSAATQVVLRALQEHGAVIYDSTTPGQDGAKLLAMSNGWAGTEHLTAQAELNTVPMSAFEVVDVSGILVDPAAGWQIHT